MRAIAVVGLIALSACATGERWKEYSERDQYLKEKESVRARLGGKLPCWTKGVVSFSVSDETPDPKCLYPPSRFRAAGEAEPGTRVARQLKVIQVTASGFLAQGVVFRCPSRGGCWEVPANRAVFVHKTTEQAVVDGAYLDDDATETFPLYEYTGPSTYTTAMGAAATVHSFKRVSEETLRKAREGVSAYSGVGEFYAQLRMWSDVNQALAGRNP